MKNMFKGAKEFDQELNGWVVSKVTDFEGMFNYAEVSAPCDH